MGTTIRFMRGRKPSPNPATETIKLRVTPSEKAHGEAVATARGISLSALIRALLAAAAK